MYLENKILENGNTGIINAPFDILLNALIIYFILFYFFFIFFFYLFIYFFYSKEARVLYVEVGSH